MKFLTWGILIIWAISFAVFALLLIPRVDIRVFVEQPEQARIIGALVAFVLFALSSATLLLARTLSRTQREALMMERETGKALRESERKYRELFEQSALPMAKSARDGSILLANRRFQELTGYSEEELTGGMRVTDVMAADAADDVLRYHEGRRKGEDIPTRYESAIVTKSGQRRDVVITTELISGSDEDITFMEDITERKNLEVQLQESQKMDALGRLAAGIAHDFNNLVTAIIGYSDLLLSAMEEQDPMRREIEVIKSAGERAALLTGHLQTFSRKQVMQPRVFELSDLVLRMREMLKRVIGEDIELVTHVAADTGRVKADPAQMEQVIMNLAINAREAMPEGGRLGIETKNVNLDAKYAEEHPGLEPGSYVMLAVRDTGVGMDDETLSRIFEPFFTTKKKGEGLGMGLSTVYGIVKQSGGSMNVFTELGGGSAFTIYLPRVEEPAEVSGLEVAPAESTYGSETVMVVEDDEAVRDIVCQILRSGGYSVLEAHSSEEAQKISEKHEAPIHLLVCDIILPDLDGPALVKRLASMRPDMRVLFISGYADEAIVRHGVLEPGLAFLPKPFTAEVLVRKVREVLEAD
ncbi:PAS domain S-box protein [bacterium]|nr:PAS domain S-box protein [bacterium]